MDSLLPQFSNGIDDPAAVPNRSDADLLEVVHDDGLEAMMPADRLGGFPCALQRTRVDLIDFERRKRGADELSLLLAELT